MSILTLLVMMLGDVMKDTESIVVAYDSTDGLSITTARGVAQALEELIAANATLGDESPFNITRHFSVRSIGAWRLVLVLVFLLHHTARSFMRPHEVHTTTTNRAHRVAPSVLPDLCLSPPLLPLPCSA